MEIVGGRGPSAAWPGARRPRGRRSRATSGRDDKFFGLGGQDAGGGNVRVVVVEKRHHT